MFVRRSKNTKSDTEKDEGSQGDMETGDGGPGLFKHMKSIDDKVRQVGEIMLENIWPGVGSGFSVHKGLLNVAAKFIER